MVWPTHGFTILHRRSFDRMTADCCLVLLKSTATSFCLGFFLSFFEKKNWRTFRCNQLNEIRLVDRPPSELMARSLTYFLVTVWLAGIGNADRGRGQ